MMSTLTVPRVTIIVLNWNGLKDTLECLDSIYMLDYPNFEVIVVDNCSSDGSVERIRRKFPQAVLIENSRNLGYTGGNNIGMHRAMELGADYVWLLNNDTVVEPDTLAKLVDASEQTPEIGLVSPIVHYYDDPAKVQFKGAYADLSNFNISLVKDLRELDNEWVQRNLILWGTALLIKKSVIENVGYLSEKYFAYCEDCDYSLRALRKNFRTMVRLDARIFHKVSQTTGKRSPIQIFLRTRNLYFLWMDNVTGLKKIFVPGYYIGMVIYNARVLSDEGNEKSFDACLNGFWAALREKEGGYDPTVVIPSWLKTIINFFVSWHPDFWIDIFKCNFGGVVKQILAVVKTSAGSAP